MNNCDTNFSITLVQNANLNTSHFGLNASHFGLLKFCNPNKPVQISSKLSQVIGSVLTLSHLNVVSEEILNKSAASFFFTTIKISSDLSHWLKR